MSHLCPDCGIEHGGDVVMEPVAEEVAEQVTDAAVEVARIEADRDVTLARIAAKTETEVATGWQEARVAELEGQLAGMRELLERLSPPEPEPTPIVVEAPEPEPVVDEPAAAPPPVAEPAPGKSKKRSNPFW